MIEVKLYLDTAEEAELFAGFSRALISSREARYASQVSFPAAEVSADVPTSAVPLGPIVCATPITLAQPVVVGQMVPTHELPFYRPETHGVTQAALEEALKAYGRAKGFPAARALLDEYTKGKLGDVPAEKHAELFAKLTA